MTEHLFTVEYCDNDEMLDHTGEGGFTVWTTRAEALEAMECESDSADELKTMRIVEYVRVSA